MFTKKYDIDKNIVKNMGAKTKQRGKILCEI
jgi:hypothetical protein